MLGNRSGAPEAFQAIRCLSRVSFRCDSWQMLPGGMVVMADILGLFAFVMTMQLYLVMARQEKMAGVVLWPWHSGP